MSVDEDRQKLLDDVKGGQARVESNARRYRKLHTGLAVTSILLGFLGSVLAADASRGKKGHTVPAAKSFVGTDPEDPTKGWRTLCLVIAVCTSFATAATILDKVLKIADHRAKAMICAGMVNSLETKLSTKMKRAELDQIIQEYIGAKREYPEYFL